MQLQTPVDLKPWFMTLEDLEGPIVWSEFFGNDNHVELDVGCGRGLYTVNASQARPDVNFLGIEIDYREGRRGATRLKKRDTPNARILGGDVNIAFDKYIADGSVDAIHVYFPDPWWKKRHHKRRLFTDTFADRIASKLKPGGYLHSWTDVGDYFKVIAALMDHHHAFEKQDGPDERTPAHEMDYQTSFERKKRIAGETIYRGLWKKRAVE